MKTVPARQLSRATGDVIEAVVRSGDPVVVTVHGRPQVAVVPLRGRTDEVLKILNKYEYEGAPENVVAAIREAEADLVSDRLLAPTADAAVEMSAPGGVPVAHHRREPVAHSPAEDRYLPRRSLFSALPQRRRSEATVVRGLLAAVDAPAAVYTPAFVYPLVHAVASSVPDIDAAEDAANPLPPGLVWAADADRFWTRLTLPGIAPSSVVLRVEEQRLTIELAPSEGSGEPAVRDYPVPGGTEAAEATATMLYGILTVSYPRTRTELPRRELYPLDEESTTSRQASSSSS